MAKKPLETAIIKNCTFLTGVQSATKIATHRPSVECLVITFTDGLQVEYLCPTNAEYYLQVVEHNTQCVCLILYPECKPAKLTFTAQE